MHTGSCSRAGDGWTGCVVIWRSTAPRQGWRRGSTSLGHLEPRACARRLMPVDHAADEAGNSTPYRPDAAGRIGGASLGWMCGRLTPSRRKNGVGVPGPQHTCGPPRLRRLRPLPLTDAAARIVDLGRAGAHAGRRGRAGARMAPRRHSLRRSPRWADRALPHPRHRRGRHPAGGARTSGHDHLALSPGVAPGRPDQRPLVQGLRVRAGGQRLRRLEAAPGERPPVLPTPAPAPIAVAIMLSP
jgi:hypothetical protein